MANEAPCDECGGLVSLDSQITVKLREEDGTEVMTLMSEFEARALLDDIGLPKPPVICDAHERREIVTEALSV